MKSEESMPNQTRLTAQRWAHWPGNTTIIITGACYRARKAAARHAKTTGSVAGRGHPHPVNMHFIDNFEVSSTPIPTLVMGAALAARTLADPVLLNI
jgi:hypothetical protein